MPRWETEHQPEAVKPPMRIKDSDQEVLQQRFVTTSQFLLSTCNQVSQGNAENAGVDVISYKLSLDNTCQNISDVLHHHC